MRLLTEEDALCREVDPDLWFPEGGRAHDSREAKRICRLCPLLDACLDYALHHGVGGIWGGTSERERQTLRVAAGITTTRDMGAAS